MLINTALILIIIMLIVKVSDVFAPLKVVSRVLLIPIIISIFLYYALRPLVKLFHHKKINKSIVILLTMLVFITALATSIIFGGIAVKDEFTGSFSYDMESALNDFNVLDNKLGGMLSKAEITDKLIEPLKNTVLQLSGSLVDIFSQIGNIGTQIILVPFILFYFLREDKKFAKDAMIIVPDKYRNPIKDMFLEIDGVLSTYISGQLLIAFIIGILMYISYLIIGMPNALLMAFFSMVTSIIPFVGPFLGMIPALLIGLTIDPTMLIKIIVATIIVQQIEGNLITPNVMGNKLNLHPLAVILIVITSVTLFGILGAFIGIPLFVVLSVALKNIHKMYIMNKLNINK